ncbi:MULTISPECIES: hypothetical protein [Halorussus]|uniref:hypothetical protein n=1 Tax=Halorussus TaxID=1070314 RepID=UPI0020A06693|nr:hypothetical protein [Halorussus vallis]USZ73864.1 hypothetical protein NGM07_10370 [Halorussus vallis]
MVPPTQSWIAGANLAKIAAAVAVPLVLALLVYLDARRRGPDRRPRDRRTHDRRASDRSTAALAWGVTTFLAGVGSPLVACCYAVVRLR